MKSSRREDAARRARAGRPARAFLVLRRLRRMSLRTGRQLRRLEIGLWATGAVLLTAAVGVRADAELYQWRAERELAELTQVVAPAPAIANRSDPERSRPALAEGTPLARLIVPRLDLDVVVAEGTGRTVLSRAVGRVQAGARPGDDGNVALAAHRDTFFRPLERIRVGDQVRLERPGGLDEYRVEWTRIVDPGDVSVLAPTPRAALTLVTCYPFDYVGPAPRRFVVRALRVGGAELAAGDPSAGRPRVATAR